MKDSPFSGEKYGLVVAAVHDSGQAMAPVRISTQDETRMLRVFHQLQPFRAVIEASASYRWLYDWLNPLGTVLVAHPLRLRAMVQPRSKTDKLDSQLLANLLRINQIPLSYVPSPAYQQLRVPAGRRLALDIGKIQPGQRESATRPHGGCCARHAGEPEDQLDPRGPTTWPTKGSFGWPRFPTPQRPENIFALFHRAVGVHTIQRRWRTGVLPMGGQAVRIAFRIVGTVAVVPVA
jgi:Transposase